jgi:hypothetical protein
VHLSATPDFKGEFVPQSCVAALLRLASEIKWDRGDGSMLSSKTAVGACRISALIAVAIMARRNLSRESDVTLRDLIFFVHPLVSISSRAETVAAGGVTLVNVLFHMRG